MSADALFDEPVPVVEKVARLSPDGVYRYTLGRRWDRALPTAVFVMLNPSTADADVDDMTIRKDMRFARGWGMGGLWVVNLYALRSTDPALLRRHSDPVGPENNWHLAKAAELAAEHGWPIVAAWGALAGSERVAEVLSFSGMDRLSVLHVTKDGQPGHPLYLPGDSKPRRWRA